MKRKRTVDHDTDVPTWASPILWGMTMPLRQGLRATVVVGFICLAIFGFFTLMSLMSGAHWSATTCFIALDIYAIYLIVAARAILYSRFSKRKRKNDDVLD